MLIHSSRGDLYITQTPQRSCLTSNPHTSIRHSLILFRLRVRDPQLTEEEARDRIASQMSLDKKKKLANYLIDNTGTQEETKDQASHVMRLISPGIVHKIVYLVAIPSFCGLWFLWFVKRLWTWW